VRKRVTGRILLLLILKEKEVENPTYNTKFRHLKIKLGIKVRDSNAFEEAGLKICDTDVKNWSYQLRWLSVGKELKSSKCSNNKKIQGERTNKPINTQKNTETIT
jgi:hypothetical protein